MSLKFLSNQTTDNKIGIGTNVLNYTLSAYANTTGNNIVASFGSALDVSQFTAIGLSGYISANGATKAGIALKRTSTYGVGELHFLNNNTTDNSDMTLSDSKMVILGNGNVGIGATTPRTKLEIGASGSLGSVTNKVISATFDGGYSLLNSLQYNVNAFIGTTFGTTDIFAQTSGEVLKNFYVGLIADNSYFNGSRYSVTQGGAERFTVDQGGNVGIGTTNPTRKLNVNGNVGINNQLLLDSANYGEHLAIRRGFYGYDTIVTGTRIDYSPTASTNTFKFLADLQTTGQLNVTGNAIVNGNVGIGTTSPDFQLDVDGTVGVTGLETSTSTMSLMANETLSSELTTNGSFATTSNWTAQLSANFTVSGGDATIISAGANSLIYQNISPSSANAILKITVNVVSFTGSSFEISFGGFSKSITETGTFTFYTTSSRTNSKLDINPSTNQTLVISDISVKEVISDQIAKRELGTGAFGPTPVGAYLPLAGGTMTGDTDHGDSVYSYWGVSNDLQIYHDGTDSYVSNTQNSGNLIIQNGGNDKDVIFKCDTGSGGTTPYLTLDGSITKMIASKDIHFDGTVKATFGSNATPASIYYNGNGDVDTGTETVANVAIATYTAAFFDFVVKKTTNVRSGTVYACHDGTSVVFTETSTNDLGDTSDVTLSVDISGGNMRLLATVTSDDWSVKSLIRAI